MSLARLTFLRQSVIFTECGQIVSFDWIYHCRHILVIVSPLVTYWFKEAKVRECHVLVLLSAWPSYHSCTLIHPVLRIVTGDFKHHYHVFEQYFIICILLANSSQSLSLMVCPFQAWNCVWEKIRAYSFKDINCWLVSQLQDALFQKICTNCSHQDSR